jgi:hypothetical protein
MANRVAELDALAERFASKKYDRSKTDEYVARLLIRHNQL